VPVTETAEFGLKLLVPALAFLVALLSSRVSARLRVPAPAIFLIGAAAVATAFPRIQIPLSVVEQIVTVALILVLFDGGMHIGWRRFRATAGAVTWLGVVGTAVTTAGLAVAAHLLFGFGWREAALLGTALAPTDPAVVFSVLAGREVGGRAGVLLEGESGANDPVGIALMVTLLGTHETGGAAVLHGTLEFLAQMLVGAAVGVVGGIGLRWFLRVSLPGDGLYPLRAPACAVVVYGVAAVAHGSGFLAVLVAGILVGDEEIRHRAEVRRFSSSLASLGEIVAFVVLGLTVSLAELGHRYAWLIGLVLALLLAFVIRPLLCGLVLWPVALGPCCGAS
jgi:cell volume regulation protein A